MVEITPRFAQQLDLPREKRDPEAQKFQLARNESRRTWARWPASRPCSAAVAILLRDPKGAGHRARPRASQPATRASQKVSDMSGSGGTGGTAPTTGPKQVEQTTTKLGGEDGQAPGLQATGLVGRRRLITTLVTDSPAPGHPKPRPLERAWTGGGGVILYDYKTGLGSKIIKEALRSGSTPTRTASDVALEQIKRHIDAGRAVVAGVSEPASSEIVDGPKIENGKEKPGTQPVTNHYVAINGYETDANGKIVGLYAKDNAVADAAEIYFKVGADGSITKLKDPRAATDYIEVSNTSSPKLSSTRGLSTKAISGPPTTLARAWYGRCHLNHQTHIRSSITSLKRFSRQSESSKCSCGAISLNVVGACEQLVK